MIYIISDLGAKTENNWCLKYITQSVSGTNCYNNNTLYISHHRYGIYVNPNDPNFLNESTDDDDSLRSSMNSSNSSSLSLMMSLLSSNDDQSASAISNHSMLYICILIL